MMQTLSEMMQPGFSGWPDEAGMPAQEPAAAQEPG